MSKREDILFSIIIPTYNRAHLIPKTIESVIAQSYSNWELIIVDDGSEDNTSEVIASFADKRIRYYYKKNEERSIARNFGIDKAKGEFINFLDDDDFLLIDFLQEFYIEIKKENISKGLIMCNQLEIDTHGNKVNRERKILNVGNPAKFVLQYANNLQPLIISKNILLEDRFDTRFTIGEDFHLLLRLVLKHTLYYLPKILCVYVNHEEMTMVKELNNNLFIDLPYNRLDTLEYFFKEKKNSLIKNNVLKPLSDRYNKISYFYASEAIKKKNNAFAKKIIKNLKWSGNIYKIVYYKLSIYIRGIYFQLLS